MKTTLTTCLITMLTSLMALTTWKSDQVHSQLTFTIVHHGFSDFTGGFEKFDVTIRSEKLDLSDAQVTMTADVNSINTRFKQRDDHLKSADFFDVEKYPQITFSSTKLAKTAKPNIYKLTGDLTMHGVTKSVTLDFIFKGILQNPTTKNYDAAAQVVGTIKRSDFGIGNGFPENAISDIVRIKADGEFAQQK